MEEIDTSRPSRRRSARATKGKHSRYDIEAEQEQQKRTPRKKQKKKEEEGIVNCPCGAKEDDPEDGKIMIECEKCLEWQHSGCVLKTNDLDLVPEHYVCDSCDPLSRSQPATETEDKVEEPAEAEASIAEEPIEEPKEKARKVKQARIEKKESEPRAEPDQAYVPKSRSQSPVNRRRSVTKTSNKRVGHIDDITEKVRQSAAAALKGIFLSVPTSDYTLPTGETAETFSEALALSIEQELYDMYGTAEPEIGSNYRDKFRTLSFNLRDAKNESLRARVVSGKVTPNTLVGMSSEEMMNPELQKLAEEVRAESIRDTVLIVDPAPRLRRTHKGEEIVGEYEEYIENVDLAVKMEKQRDGDGEEAKVATEAVHEAVAHIKGGSPPVKGTNGDVPAEEASERDSNSPPVPKWTAGIDLGMDDHVSEDETHHNGDSDHDDKLKDILGDVTKEAREAETDDWAEIARAPFTWAGNVSMSGLEPQDCLAFSLGCSSPLFDPNTSWSTVFHASKPLAIEGRLDRSKADPYLEKVLGGGTRDVAAFAIVPSDTDVSKGAYNDLYDYFHSRQKYGVIQNRTGAVKDAYLIPVAPDQLPPYILGSLVRPSVELSQLKRSRPLLIAVYVIGKVGAKKPQPPPEPAAATRQYTPQPIKAQPQVLPPADISQLQNLLADPSLQGTQLPSQADLLQNPGLLMSLIDQAKRR